MFVTVMAENDKQYYWDKIMTSYKLGTLRECVLPLQKEISFLALEACLFLSTASFRSSVPCFVSTSQSTCLLPSYWYQYSCQQNGWMTKGTGHMVEVNVRLSLCFVGHHTVKMYGGVQVQFHRVLTSSLVEGGGGSLHALTVCPQG